MIMLKDGYIKNEDGTRTKCLRCSICKKTFPTDTKQKVITYHEEHCFPKGYLEKSKDLEGKYFTLSKPFMIYSCACVYGFQVTNVTNYEILIQGIGTGAFFEPYIMFKDRIGYDDMIHSKEIDRDTFEKFTLQYLDSWKFKLCPWLIEERTEDEKFIDDYIPKGRLKGTELTIGSPIVSVAADSDFDYLIRNLDKMKTGEWSSITFVQYKDVYKDDIIEQTTQITYDKKKGYRLFTKYVETGETKEIRFNECKEMTHGWTWIEFDISDYKIYYGHVRITMINSVSIRVLREQYKVKEE